MPFSPDRPSLPSVDRVFFPEEKQFLRHQMIADLLRVIEMYEHRYLPEKEVPLHGTTPLTKERYAKFETWLQTLSKQKTLTEQEGIRTPNQVFLVEDAKNAVSLYAELCALVTGRPLDPEILERYSP